MLVKKELATVPVQMLPDAEECTQKRDRRWNTARGEISAAAEVVKLPRSGNILIVDFFENETLAIRFVSDGKNYLTCREWPATAWTQQNPRHIIGVYASTNTDADQHLAEDFLQLRRKSYYSDGLTGVVDSFISTKAEEARDRTARNAYDLRERHFAMFPKYPKDLVQFCKKHLFNGPAYIFIGKVDRAGKRTAVCSHCGKRFTLGREARSGHQTTCPKCGHEAVYRGNWLTKLIEQKDKVCITAKVDGQLLIRWTDVHRRLDPSTGRAQYAFEDTAYNLYLQTKRGPKVYFYKWMRGPYCYGYDWYRGKLGEICYDTAKVYTNNLAEVFGRTYYNVDLQAGLERADVAVSLTRLLDCLKNRPEAEYLFKAGLVNLAASANLLPRCTGRPSFSSVLGISKQMLPLYRETNPTYSEHQIIAAYGGWLTAEELLAYRAFDIQPWEVNTVEAVLRDMPLPKMIRYITQQKKLYPKRKAIQLMQIYRDYIDTSRRLQVDLTHKSVHFPKDSIVAHDRIVARFNELKHEVENREFENAVAKIYPKLACTSFVDKGLCIMLPQKRSDLISEGQSLNHCVGGDGYYQRHIAGESMIFSFGAVLSRRSHTSRWRST